MSNIIVVSDLHIKNSFPRIEAIYKFFDWLIENYKDYTFVFLGDLFDSNSIRGLGHNCIDNIIEYLLKLNEVHIIGGNHDILYRGYDNILLPLRHHKNLSIYLDEKVETTIGSFKCLMMPYSDDMTTYSEAWKGDYAFGHFFLEQDSFGGKFVDVSKIDVQNIFLGHLHEKRNYGKTIVPGVPIVSKNLEKNNNIYMITSDCKVKEIETPVFYDIVDIDFNTDIKNLNENYLYNIKNAPSLKSVWDKFKGFNIRRAGIEIRSFTDETEVNAFDFEANNLIKYFKEFANKKGISKEFQEEIFSYLTI